MTENQLDLNRQAIRSIEALQAALLELLKQKPFRKIRITEIAETANLTRSTFYAHFETKEELLNSIVNNILDEFFEEISRHNVQTDPNPIRDLELKTMYFKTWEKYKEILPLLHSVDFDCLIVERLKSYWHWYNQNYTAKNFPNLSESYLDFITTYLAYSFAGMLKEWINKDFQPSAEVIAKLFYDLFNPSMLTNLYENYQGEF